MPRLFTAIELAPAVRASVEAYQTRLARDLDPGGRSLRLMPAGQFHVTLVFVGEVDDAVTAHLVGLMSQPFMAPPFTLAFGGAGVFPARGVPKVLWLGVDQGGAPLTDLVQLVAARAASAGVDLERRTYRPHLTLGRWREGKGPMRAPRLPAPPAVPEQPVRAVTLFESRLLPHGADHRPLARAPLTGIAPPLH